MEQKIGGWIIGMVLSMVTCLALGLTVVWINIERVDIAYGLQKLQREVEKQEAHREKLELERDNLTSPYRLRVLAEKLGMRPAQSGQIRRLEH